MKEHKEVKDDIRERRKLVSMLLRSGGLTAPDRFAGEVDQSPRRCGLIPSESARRGFRGF